MYVRNHYGTLFLILLDSYGVYMYICVLHSETEREREREREGGREVVWRNLSLSLSLSLSLLSQLYAQFDLLDHSYQLTSGLCTYLQNHVPTITNAGSS